MSMKAQIENRWSKDQLITGIEIPEWVSMLAKNRFKVDPLYLHRAAWITGLSLPATVLGRLEDAIYGKKLATMTVDPSPIFLLGHWRTGTTHLQNLFMRDPQHTSPTYYQVVFPGAFLLTGDIVPRLAQSALAQTRSYDNVRQGWHEAAEDEIALAKLTGLSIYCSFMFPETAAHYEKYVDFLEATPAEKERWKAAFLYFLKKIILATGKRVVVKSCAHTARVPLLLEMFPDAKFVHIHRNPYETFASTLHLRSKVDWENFFQRPEETFLQERWEQTAAIGHKVWERIIEDRKLIPPENFVELAYSEFEGNELEHLRRIYQQFALPGWERYEAVLTPYLESLKGYRKNKLTIDAELKDFVWERWRTVFDTYGYGREYP
jgi:omega-hydroxy-beta-dihydromenaquinone-9 sulfotransferase